jgi:hypothetical protein
MSDHHICASDFEHRHEYDAAIDGANVILALTHAVNGSGEKHVINGIARELACSHRTLQAGAVRVMLKALVKWAKDADANCATDLRNEAAVKAVLKLASLVDDNPIPFI